MIFFSYFSERTGIFNFKDNDTALPSSSNGSRTAQEIGLEHLQTTKYHRQNFQKDRPYGLFDPNWSHLRGRI